MTTYRIQALESLGFEWDFHSAVWDDRLSELADFHRIHRHCNVSSSENTRLASWVSSQRTHYRLDREGKASQITLSRIQALESLGFEWDSQGANWEHRFSELTEYHGIHRHCNVPYKYSENPKLATWVKKQRYDYGLDLKGKASNMTTYRIQALESLGFEWDTRGAVWEDRLSELTEYHRIHRRCNVPRNHTQLGEWVKTQRKRYRLHLQGKKSSLTPLQIQALKSLGFE
jgi:hypothetical protein